MWRIHLDLTAKMPETTQGNRYIAIAICAFIKFVEALRNPDFL